MVHHSVYDKIIYYTMYLLTFSNKLERAGSMHDTIDALHGLMECLLDTNIWHQHRGEVGTRWMVGKRLAQCIRRLFRADGAPDIVPFIQ